MSTQTERPPHATSACLHRNGGGALDWPLSRSEKKGHVMRLYDLDISTANCLLQSGETAMATLRQELQALKATKASNSSATSDPTPGSLPPKPGNCSKAQRQDSDSSGEVTCNSPGLAEQVSTIDNDDKAMLCNASGLTPPSVGKKQTEGVPLGKAAECVEPKVSSAAGEQIISKCCKADVPKKRLSAGGGPNVAAERLQRAIAEATDALSALLGAAALEQEEDDLDASWEETCNPGHLMRSRSEGADRMMLPSGGLRKTRRRRVSRGGEPLRVAFAEGEATNRRTACEAIGEPQHLAMGDWDPDSEPEPPPEAPSSPEPQPQHLESHLQASQRGWQRSLPLALSSGRRGPGACRLEYDEAPRDRELEETPRGRRRERRGRILPLRTISIERPKAPTTTMDFL